MTDCPRCGGRLVDEADIAAKLVGVAEQVSSCQSCEWAFYTLVEDEDDDGDLVESGGTW